MKGWQGTTKPIVAHASMKFILLFVAFLVRYVCAYNATSTKNLTFNFENSIIIIRTLGCAFDLEVFLI